MDEYECECGVRHYSYSALMHCDCLYEDRHGYPKHVPGGDWID